MPDGFLSSRPLGASGLECRRCRSARGALLSGCPPKRGWPSCGPPARRASTFSMTPATTTRRARLHPDRVFRGAVRGVVPLRGVRRDEAVVANKLWWEFWPSQSAAAELDASLRRMGFEHVDVIYANAPPPGMAVADLVEAVSGLVASGKARSWGLVNWPADLAGGRRGGREPRRGPALRGPAALQPGTPLVGRGSRHDTGPQCGWRWRDRLILPGGRCAHGQAPVRSRGGPRRGDADRSAGRGGRRSGGGTGRPGPQAGFDRGRAGHSVPADQPSRHERSVRGHQRGAGPGQLRRDQPAGPSRPGRPRAPTAHRAARGPRPR